MTPLKIIEKQIYKFLESETPEVIAIRGAWGTGKTYAWNKYIRKAQRDEKVFLDKYSYVSLFGIDSLEALKFAIFEKSIKKNLIGKEPSLETFKENTTSLLGSFGKKSILWAKFIATPFKLDGIVGQAVSFLSVNKTIICLDDFERMSLDAQNVLGLISELKEQKGCKIALILNDEGLGKDAKEKYNTYREKVIDKEFNFLPTPEECAEIVLETECYANILKERCCKIGIQNIRVIKKISQLKEELIPFLADCEDETKHKALSSLVLFTYYLHTKKDDISDIEFIRKMNLYGLSEDENFSELLLEAIQDQEQGDEKERKKLSEWISLVRDYKGLRLDELDLEIANSVERGYFVDSNIKREIIKYNESVKMEKQSESLIEARATYYDSFDDNAADLLKKIYEAAKNHINHISQASLNDAIWMLRELDANDKADELIELVISKQTNAEYFNRSNYAFMGSVLDKKMIGRFAETYTQRKITKTPLEVLVSITSRDGWGSQDEDVLASLSAGDYYNLFKSLKGAALSVYIRRCLQFGLPSNASEKQKQIAQNTKEALRKIASESKLNQSRIKRFKIED